MGRKLWFGSSVWIGLSWNEKWIGKLSKGDHPHIWRKRFQLFFKGNNEDNIIVKSEKIIEILIFQLPLSVGCLNCIEFTRGHRRDNHKYAIMINFIWHEFDVKSTATCVSIYTYLSVRLSPYLSSTHSLIHSNGWNIPHRRMMIVFIVLLNLDSLSFYCANRQHEKQRVFDFYAHATRDQQRLRQLLFARFYDQTNVSWHWDWADCRSENRFLFCLLTCWCNCKYTECGAKQIENSPVKSVWWLHLIRNRENYWKIRTFFDRQIRSAADSVQNELLPKNVSLPFRTYFGFYSIFQLHLGSNWQMVYIWNGNATDCEWMRRQINRFIHNSMHNWQLISML